MIYGLLEAGQYFEEAPEDSCTNDLAMVAPGFRTLFIFFQMYFIFLNTKIMIYKYKKFARFGFMHMVATNLCVWMNCIIQESQHSIHEFQHTSHDTHADGHSVMSNTSHINTTDHHHTEGHHRVRRGADSQLICNRNNMMGRL